MLFNSYAFIFFYLPLSMAGFFLLGRRWPVAAAAWLGVMSVFFYAWGSDQNHVIVLLSSIVFNYMIGISISRARIFRRLILTFGVGVNLGLLGYFKYAGFLTGLADIEGWQDIALPLGISFFTFTQIAYLVDAYRSEAKEYHPVHYLLFVTYFPHLIAGPILHHGEMIPQFKNRSVYRAKLSNISVGLSIFILGLVKKVLLADSVAPYGDPIFDQATVLELTMAEAWTGALAFTLQIYFDFSAYSDMAIGISKMFGVKLPLNFASPYKAESIIEFWRRWHITLSRFLRDYLYISLGGNRKGIPRRYANLMITMLLGGLWHGAGWTFIIWGGLHGLYLSINHMWRSFGLRLTRLPSVAITFFMVVIAWVFFRAESVAAALNILKAMLGGNGLPLPRQLQPLIDPLIGGFGWVRFDGLFHNRLVNPLEAWPVLAGLLAIVWLAPNVHQLFRDFDPALIERRTNGAWTAISRSWLSWRASVGWSALCGGLLAGALTLLQGESPFLYFRF